jgi:membrane protein implicated in regulation of membrane protease activity
MPSPWRRLALHSALLVAVLGAVAAVLSLLGGAVLLPQLGAVAWVVAGALLFLGLQLLIFRAFRLRSRADDQAAHEEDERERRAPGPGNGGDANADDWRAWRG